MSEAEMRAKVQEAYQQEYGRAIKRTEAELEETTARVQKKIEKITERMSGGSADASQTDGAHTERKPGPHSHITLHRSQGGNYTEEKQYFRMSAENKLEVWTATGKKGSDGKPEYTWQGADDRSSRATAQQYTCLYVSNGKILDSSGREVSSLGTGGNAVVSSKHIMSSIDLHGEGTVSGLKSDQLNALTYRGKRVVFTEGPPPASHGSTPHSTTTPPTTIAGEHRDTVKLPAPHGTRSTTEPASRVYSGNHHTTSPCDNNHFHQLHLFSRRRR